MYGLFNETQRYVTGAKIRNKEEEEDRKRREKFYLQINQLMLLSSSSFRPLSSPASKALKTAAPTHRYTVITANRTSNLLVSIIVAVIWISIHKSPGVKKIEVCGCRWVG